MSQQSQTTNRKKKLKNNRIILNVGGKRFEPYENTLQNHPDMPLAWITRNKDKLDYDPETGELFFDRHPMVFAQILNYFQTGKLHCPRGMCGPCFQDELMFWGIHEQQMESCCWSNYTSHREAQANLKALDLQPRYFNSEENLPRRTKRTSKKNQKLSWEKLKPIIWEFLDEPYSSKKAKIYSWISLIFVVISIFIAAFWTLSLFQDQKPDYTDAKRYLMVVEGICTSWFTVEFVSRLVFSPNLKLIFTNCQNWIDLISIIPAYFILFGAAGMVIKVLTCFRVVRIFRFLKLLYDLQIIGKTLRVSSNLFLVLLFVLLIPVLIFSSVLYYTEGNHGDSYSKPKYTSIPAALWWGLITVTTVGYGDLSPASLPGQIFGVFCALCGVLLIAMSASIAGSSFVLYYNLARAQMKLPRKRQNLDIDVESLPTIINFNNIANMSLTYENSAYSESCSNHADEHTERFEHNQHNINHGRDNGTLMVTTTSTPNVLHYDEGYFDLVKNSVMLDRQTSI